MDDEERIASIAARLRTLRPSQITAVEASIDALGIPVEIWVNPESDLITAQIADAIADTLLAHHASSLEPFTKDKTEYALVRIFRFAGRNAEKSPRTFPGDDLKIDEERFSIKSQADSGIRRDEIHISKFMELGRGKWEDEADLAAMRDRMLAHMENYDRILDLRCLSMSRAAFSEGLYEYELVEIPKAVLARARTGAISMMHGSRQTPKPGVCRVSDDQGLVFELYFDGGTERKLQIRHLRKSACVVHATWKFTVLK